MKTLGKKIVGVAPLLLHNCRLSDPLDELTQAIKAVSSKRKKTDADIEEMARLEWHGSLYLNDKLKVIVPAHNIVAMLIAAARKNKLGKQFAAGVFVNDDCVLQYSGPNDVTKLWEDKRFQNRSSVKIQRNRVMRTRPMFTEWSLEIKILYDPSIVKECEINAALEIAGAIIGLGDWRPQYGRFDVA